MGIPASLQSEFSLTPAGTKNPGHVNSIAYKDQSNITALFGLIRQHHPRFQIADSDEAKMVWDIPRGMARVVDGLNPARNEMSLAHPNALLDAPEAMLVINAIRTMLHYLDNRLK